MERDEGGRHAAISYQRPEKADPLGQMRARVSLVEERHAC